ncbi:trypsin, alkaline C-like [Vanessa cardui]|uniref:trypsin, alkaline C-like n=1 Tax=Vanessa cardui TaxID=171605 RepID=UPI001F13D5ED|nr:trypsin, alkaline C-like [Vanessa cardui]
MTSFWVFIVVLFVGSISASPDRIVGGQPTTVERYPSIVQVEFLSQLTSVWSHNCGGRFDFLSYVYRNSDAPFRRIRAGATYRHVGGLVVYVDEALNHPSYGSSGIGGDISVVRLKTALSYSPTIQQATIVTHGSTVPDNHAVVFAGWGRIASGGPHSHVLRDVTVYTINNELCAQLYTQLSVPLNVTQDMICAGVLNVGGRDACHDDSGGPVYFGDIVVGVISFGYDCANGSWPSISSAVGSYTDWIVESAVLT